MCLFLKKLAFLFLPFGLFLAGLIFVLMHCWYIFIARLQAIKTVNKCYCRLFISDKADIKIFN